MTFYYYVSTTSQTSLKWNTQRCVNGMSPRRLSGTYPRPPISTCLRRLLWVPNETPNNVGVIRLHRCRDVLLVGPYCFFKLLCHNLHLVEFYVSFKYQIKTPNFPCTNHEGNRNSLDYKVAELLLSFYYPEPLYMHRQ